jgi:membrane protease YdiL (CAAX protease family)
MWLTPFHFFLNPNWEASETIQEKKRNLTNAFKFVVYAHLIYLSILVVLHFVFDLSILLTDIERVSDKLDTAIQKKDWWLVVSMGIVIAPIIEELAFRAGLSMKKKSIAVSAGFLTYSICKIFLLDSSWISSLIAIIVLTIAWSQLSDLFIEKLKRFYRPLFYASFFLFVLLHITNYKLEASLIPALVCILLVPKCIGTMSLAFLRVNGLLWSILFHACNNAIVFLPKLMYG